MSIDIIKKSKTEIAAQLKPFVESLHKFVPHYENIIVKISESLPEIEKGIDDNITEARELLNFLFITGTQEESYGIKNEIMKFHQQLDKILSKMKEMDRIDKKILSSLKSSIDISNNTIEEINKIDDISENLKVYAINSIVNSHKAGDRGRGYQIISSEFIRYSENIASETQEIFKISDRLKNDMIGFLNAVEELENFSKNHMDTISADSSRILERGTTSIKNFSDILDDFLNRIETAKDPTYHIMVELQKQDIIHQQLEHLILNVDDMILILEKNAEALALDPENIPDSEKSEVQSLYTLLMYLVENTEHQIRRISVEFLSMIEKLEELFRKMNASVQDINSDKAEFAKVVLQDQKGNESRPQSYDELTTIVGYIFDSPELMVSEIRDDLNSILNKKNVILELFSNLENNIEAQRERTQTLLPVIDSIKSLLLLSRIEQARYNLDFSIAGVGREAGFFDESFASLSSIINDIETAHQQVFENFAATRTSFIEQEEHYNSMQQNFTASIAALDQTKNIFMDHFTTVMNITNTLVEEITDYTEFFEQLRRLDKDINGKITVCTEIRENLLSKLNQLGGRLPLEECRFKDLIYEKIVQKCTVSQERETIQQNFKEIEIEESKSNSITLF